MLFGIMAFAGATYHCSLGFHAMCVCVQVDAALDSSNLSRVATYIRQRTRSSCENPFQGIIISLKDVFYEKADALIGVSRNLRCNASAVYTFDLEPFGEPQV